MQCEHAYKYAIKYAVKLRQLQVGGFLASVSAPSSFIKSKDFTPAFLQHMALAYFLFIHFN